MQENPLSKELAFYETHAAEFKQHHMGKFVLIKGEELVGAFDTLQAAYEEGLKRFGNVPMLIKQVSHSEKPETLPALVHGVLIALP